MHITKIELQDIKSHAHSIYEFLPGTTAITGENGAGKTTIIEAIAWALFDLLDYKKDDFVRRGARKGSVRVTFESSLDEREYTVYRDTATGYYVYDPALKLRIAEKKDEVCRFLWQHLGVEPGTDLDSLFRRAIGVPQGTFTAIFLESSAERKKAFDKLLKVEEYRRGADELLKTSRYIEQQISAASVNIARAEGELARWDTVEAEHKDVASSVDTLSSALLQLDTEIAAKADDVKAFDEKEQELQSARNAFEAARSEHSQTELVALHKENMLKQACDAAEKVEQVRVDSARHIDSLGRLKELERERAAREALRIECLNIEAALAAVRAELKNVQEKLENALNAHSAIESMRPAAVDQERLEKLVGELRERSAAAKAAQSQIKSLEEKVERLREIYRKNHVLITDTFEKSKDAIGTDELERRDAEIVRELARLQAHLERDEKFQSEIKNGLCPILSQKCLNLDEGQTLEGFVSSQFTELRTKIATLQVESTRVATALRSSRDAERFAAQLTAFKDRESELTEEGGRLNAELDKLRAEYAENSAATAELAAAEAQLRALGDPKGKIGLYEVEVLREPELRMSISNIESNLERLESDRRIKVEQLESYKDLDELIAEAAADRDKTEAAHKVFLANDELARTVELRETERNDAKSKLAILTEKLAAAEAESTRLGRDYDSDAHTAERAALLNLQNRQIETRANLETARNREQVLSAELERLVEIRTALRAQFAEKERLEKVCEATEFIRSTLKEAAPRVARNYVYLVSVEANQLFREITGNAERTLKWSEDYGIMLEEGGYDRPFINLSGGEQMAAALSVRLALLKQLSDIRIAFFDEPTTNMDAERRENLAAEIGRIKHFDQLFVISHDDTFEGYVDNHIRVGA